MKYFFAFVIVAFLLYWSFKGIVRRLFAPPQTRSQRRVPNQRGERMPSARETSTAIDYSKVRDANFRDIE